MSEEIISEHLDWDSQFFGIEISKIYVNNYDIDVIKNSVRSSIDSGAKLIYLIIPAEIDKKMIYSSHLIDDKVVYTKEIGNTGQFDNKISQYNATNVNEELYELAFESGKYSRFKLDKNLPSGSFEKLYSLWIERSVKGEIADEVFVYREEDIIQGMVTLKLLQDHGEIGLISSKSANQGKGIGTKLISHCEKYLSTKGINRVEVTTQAANTAACNFYEKNGYKIIKSLNYYHIWNK